MRTLIITCALVAFGYGVWLVLIETGTWSVNYSAFSEYGALLRN